MIVSIKVSVPIHFYPLLNELKQNCRKPVKRMLENRKESSSKFYPEIPCVVAKSLVRKYQRNKKCRSVTNLVIAICGDRGRQVKLTEEGIRIPAITKKEVIPVIFRKPVSGYILNVEFFKKKGNWYLTVQYNTPKIVNKPFTNVIGVDRNTKGNVVTAVCNSKNQVRVIGPDTYSIKENFRNRRANLQKKGAKEALKKLSMKQLNVSKDINHKVSREIVNFAINTSSAIVLEDLGTINKGKAARFVKKSQWAFYQLDTFIRYKAALHGIPVFYVNPYNTSKQCSKCGTINNPSCKVYKCSCGYFGHRDINASFNIINRFKNATSNVGIAGLSGNPLNLLHFSLQEKE